MGLIPPGVLRQRLTVLRKARVSNGAGGWTDSFASMGVIPGQITAIENRYRDEGNYGGQPMDVEIVNVQADTSAISVNDGDRLQDPDGRVYELVSVTRQGNLLAGLGRRVDA